MYNDNKGYKYEEIAKKYMLANKFKILEENYMCRLGEIDIIAAKNNKIHFVEVKGRLNTLYGYPREAVTKAKQKKIINAAKYYFMCKGYDDVFCQFDVIEIILENKEINYIENAYWLE